MIYSSKYPIRNAWNDPIEAVTYVTKFFWKIEKLTLWNGPIEAVTYVTKFFWKIEKLTLRAKFENLT